VDDPHQRFADLYDRYYRNVLRYSLQHADSGSAEDVASEVFLIAWRQLPEVPEPPLPWLLGVARNLLRQQAGARRRRGRLTDRIAALTSAADMTAGDAGERVVDRASALAVLASLPGRDVEALTLVTWHGLDVPEAAAAAGCSPRAFTVRLHRARRRLTLALRSADHYQELPARSPAGASVRHAASFCQPSTSNRMEKA
jgi:RNA polymerase sigma factor (sigma-70 family)